MVKVKAKAKTTAVVAGTAAVATARPMVHSPTGDARFHRGLQSRRAKKMLLRCAIIMATKTRKKPPASTGNPPRVGMLERKHELLHALLQQLAEAIDVVDASARSAHEAATHEEAKPENDKDTRGLEQAYLATGQSARVVEMQRSMWVLQAFRARDFAAGEAISVGAWVELLGEDDGDTLHVFITPLGGGTKTTVGGVAVTTVSEAAPLAAALLGKRAGDDVEIPRAGGKRSYQVVSVS
jgi:transcription elongation GreA/GreB family factor